MLSLIPKEQEQRCLDAIIGFFQHERDEEIGVIAAQEVLDFFNDHLAPVVYNAGVQNAKEAFLAKSEDITVDLELLKKDVR